MKYEHLSSVQKKVTELLAAKYLAVNCTSSLKQDIVSHHSIKFKSARQLLGFLCYRMRSEHLSSVKQKVTELLAAKDLAVDSKSSFK